MMYGLTPSKTDICDIIAIGNHDGETKLRQVRDRLNDPDWIYAGVTTTFSHTVVHFYHFFKKK